MLMKTISKKDRTIRGRLRFDSRHFVPGRRAKTARAKMLVEWIKGQVFAEGSLALRTLRDSKKPQKLEAQFEALLCDAIHRGLTRPEDYTKAGIKIRLIAQGKSRYRPELMTGVNFSAVLSALVGGRWLRSQKGKTGEYLTVFWPTTNLMNRVVGDKITLKDLRDIGGVETLLLKGPAEVVKGYARKPLVEYEDTDQTNAMRLQMDEVNDWLDQSDITLLDYRTNLPCQGAFEDKEGNDIDVSMKRQYRVFSNGAFEQGGRLYGGFWTTLPKATRFDRMRINGKKVVEVDYKQLHPTILYALEGLPLSGDAYDIVGVPKRNPVPEGTTRDTIKRMLNAMLNHDRKLGRNPHGVTPIPGLTGPKLASLIETQHSAIAHYFGAGVGLKLQRIDSDLIVRVLLALKQQGIVAVSIHDAVLVAEGDEYLAGQVMIEEARKTPVKVGDKEIAGFDATVAIRRDAL